MIHVATFVIAIYAMVLFAKKTNFKFMLWLACAIMICISGLRHGYIDTRLYRQGFEGLKVNSVFSWNFLLGESSSKGFNVLAAIIKVFTQDSQAYLFILALITVGLLFVAIVKRVPNIELGIFLLITTGCFLDSMNGVRQYLASAILFISLPKYIKEKKFVKYALIVLLMSTIHASALLFIPLYFIARVKVWGKGTWFILIVALLLGAFFNFGVGETIAKILEGTEYGDDYSDMLIAGNTSVNIIRVFVALVPLVLSFITKDNKVKQTPMYTIAFNMSLINFAVWIFATRALYFYRLAMYFTPYMILLLCYEIYSIKDEFGKFSIYFFAVLLFFIFHLYSCYVMGDSLFVGYLKY